MGVSRAVAILGWTGYVAWVGVLCYLSSLPPKNFVVINIPHIDKVVHFLYFAAGAGCLATAWAFTFRWRKRVVFFGCLAIMAGAGILDEWHQNFTPGRSGSDGMDFAADLAGSITGILVAIWIYEYYRRRTAKTPIPEVGD